MLVYLSLRKIYYIKIYFIFTIDEKRKVKFWTWYNALVNVNSSKVVSYYINHSRYIYMLMIVELVSSRIIEWKIFFVILWNQCQTKLRLIWHVCLDREYIIYGSSVFYFFSLSICRYWKRYLYRKISALLWFYFSLKNIMLLNTWKVENWLYFPFISEINFITWST